MSKPADQPSRSLTIARADARTFVLADRTGRLGSVSLARRRTTSGEIAALGQHWPVTCHPHRWWQVDVGDPSAPALQLRRHDATVPGVQTPISWGLHGRVARFHATLVGANRSITIDCTGWHTLHGTAEVRGAWPQYELTVLAGFFAVLARRRRTILLLSS